MFDVNSTAQLLGAFGVLDRVKPVLLNMFFQDEQVFDTEEVYFDRVQRARKIAAFVAPTVAGKADRARGYSTGSFKPSYVKPKHVVEPGRALKRRAGERLLGELSPEARFQLAILDNLMLEDEEIMRAEEWMAAQLLLSGMMTVSTPDFPSMVVDLQRNAAHTIVLTGAARWGQAGVDPLQVLRSWAKTVQSNSGFHPSTVVMDPLAADIFQTSPSVLRVMQTFRQTTGNVDLAGKVTGGGLGHEVKYLGSLAEFDFYQYQQIYTDASGAVQKYMPDNSVIMGNPDGCGGVRTYGAIRDSRANLQALPRFPKVWQVEDPSATFTMTQSAPLPLLGWADATLAATVG